MIARRAAGAARVRRAARSRTAGGGGGGDGAGAARPGRMGGRRAADRQSHPESRGNRPMTTRKMMRAKIHRATVTQADVDYEGSITIDRRLMDATDLLPNEAVCVWNVTNGNRFETYVVEGPPDSGVICVNGAAAHLVSPGDLVIIAAFTWMDEDGGAAPRAQGGVRRRATTACARSAPRSRGRGCPSGSTSDSGRRDERQGPRPRHHRQPAGLPRVPLRRARRGRARARRAAR